MPYPKGKPQSPASIAKRKAAFARADVKEKMSAAKRGTKQSAELVERRTASLRGRKRPPEVGQKVSAAKRGNVVVSEAQRRQSSEAMKAHWADPEFRERMSGALTGKVIEHRRPASPETIERLRVSHTGKRRSVESRLKQGQSIAGPNHHYWKGGTSRYHRGVGWGTVKRLVRERAGGRCEFCGGVNIRGWQLDVHHVIPYREIPVSVDWACLALCRKCHLAAERGKIDTTALQDTLRPLLTAPLPKYGST